MGEHALLSASSAHRWLKCSPSVRLEEEVEDNTSIYAKEGTFAHDLAEQKLLNYLGDKKTLEKVNNAIEAADPTYKNSYFINVNDVA